MSENLENIPCTNKTDDQVLNQEDCGFDEENFSTTTTQGCKNMLTFLTPESPDFQSFLVLSGVLNKKSGIKFPKLCYYRVLRTNVSNLSKKWFYWINVL